MAAKTVLNYLPRESVVHKDHHKPNFPKVDPAQLKSK